jgi:hypothetical protein
MLVWAGPKGQAIVLNLKFMGSEKGKFSFPTPRFAFSPPEFPFMSLEQEFGKREPIFCLI